MFPKIFRTSTSNSSAFEREEEDEEEEEEEEEQETFPTIIESTFSRTHYEAKQGLSESELSQP